jgi:hypothetical protein
MHHGLPRPLPLLVALGACAALTACSGQSWLDAGGTTAGTTAGSAATTAAPSGAPASSAAGRSSAHPATASRSAAEDTDSVQTDPPVTAVDSAVVLTYAGWSPADRLVQGSAFAQGHLDADATCVLTASRAGAATVTGTPTAATPGPSSTDCGPLTLRLPSSATGSWQIAVVYAVGGTRLTSSPTEVQVP